MSATLDLYYFSPTGGTRKTAASLAATLAETIIAHDFGSKQPISPGTAELALIAAPVFAGRIPALVADGVKSLAGAGKKVVTLVIYGNRAYEDALLELNDCAKEAGFSIIASGAFVANHSIVRFSGVGRPDERDLAELADFGNAILAKLNQGSETEPEVPGDRPYRAGMTVPATPIFLPSCVQCGKCMRTCPTGAIQRNGKQLITDTSTCILCMACVAACPTGSRILPPPMQEAMNNRLAHLKDVRNGNARFL